MSVSFPRQVHVMQGQVKRALKVRDLLLMAEVGSWLDELDGPVPRPSGRPAWPRGLYLQTVPERKHLWHRLDDASFVHRVLAA
jgi:hypothetical protein